MFLSLIREKKEGQSVDVYEVVPPDEGETMYTTD